MKCYALGTRFGDKPFKWLTPGNNLISFFAQKALAKHKEQIVAYCEELGGNETRGFEKEGYYFYVKRVGADYCTVVGDTELNEKQMNYLAWYLLILKIDLSIVASDIEKYTNDQKVEQLKADLAEVNKIMLENIDNLVLRGERIEEVVKKTENLASASFQFKDKAKELNSCWPSSCVLT